MPHPTTNRKQRMTWFRFYTDALDDPKVQRLPGQLYKTWVNILCLAGQNDGKIPSIDDLAFRLRISVHEAQQQFDELVLAGLIDILPDKTREPHNWNARQFKSDTSNERVRKHREKHKETECNVTCNVTETEDVTPPEQIQSRSETETEAESHPPASAERSAPAAVRLDLRELSDRLFEAAGPALASQAIAPGLAAMTVPAMWIDQGCDLELDIIETLRAQSTKRRGIMSWEYFTRAVAEAKAKRLAGLPKIDISTSAPQQFHQTFHGSVKAMLAEMGVE